MKPRHIRIAVIAVSLTAVPFALAAGDASDKNTMDKSASGMDKPRGTSDQPASRTDRSRSFGDAETFSDRPRMDEWSSGKDRLEQALQKGQDKDFFRREIERLGYQITAVNEDDRDKLEYEIVKGDNSYEVHVDLDNGKVTKVEVTSNMWKADATERALENNRRSGAGETSKSRPDTTSETSRSQPGRTGDVSKE